MQENHTAQYFNCYKSRNRDDLETSYMDNIFQLGAHVSMVDLMRAVLKNKKILDIPNVMSKNRLWY